MIVQEDSHPDLAERLAGLTVKGEQMAKLPAVEPRNAAVTRHAPEVEERPSKSLDQRAVTRSPSVQQVHVVHHGATAKKSEASKLVAKLSSAKVVLFPAFQSRPSKPTKAKDNSSEVVYF